MRFGTLRRYSCHDVLMGQITVAFTVVNAEDYSGPAESFDPVPCVLTGPRSELLRVALQTADIDRSASRIWDSYFASDAVGLWVLPRDLASHAGRLRSDDVGTCMCDPVTTLGQFADYFGPLARDTEFLAVYPVSAIGGGPLGPWIELGTAAQEYLTERTAWEMANDLLTIYGGAEIGRRVLRWLAALRLRKLRHDGRAWLHQGRVTRRTAGLVDSRPEWRCDELAALLGLDHGSAGRLLAARRFELSAEDLMTWRHVDLRDDQ